VNTSEAKAAAQKTGCTLIEQNITLVELNQMLQGSDPSCEASTRGRLFADFSLGSKLGFVLAIGTASSLRQLHLKAGEVLRVM
jgi:hypothetical protein